MQRAALLSCLALALFASGCGGDKEHPRDTSTATSPAAAPSQRDVPSTPTLPGNTEPGKAPPDSPQGRYDQFCKENPSACD